ncbi:MAG: trypsin-like peptidase domain-containing protein [bacterium]
MRRLIGLNFQTNMRRLLALLLAAVLIPPLTAVSAEKLLTSAVIKIYVSVQNRNYALPWQALPPMQASGTGFVISRKRILTNAHVVSNARFIQVQKNQEATLHAARVSFIGHDCDLAILEVDEPDFFEGTRPAPLSEILPQLNDEVSVLGYPVGGTKLSVTRGVVSRIDYGEYSHSGVDNHLVLQVDAAINPGNSGGPVFYQGKVVGMAFQGLMHADNIGYAIPMPVIKHFLADISDGTYNGYPELGAATLSIQNPALVKEYKLKNDLMGVVVYYLDPYGAAAKVLKPGDVLMAIDNHEIRSDGTVRLDNTTMEYHELLERKQWGESVNFRIWRGGATTNAVVPLTNPRDPFVFRNLYDETPDCFIIGGLVFSPLTREYLKTLGQGVGTGNAQQLLYYSLYAKTDNLAANREEFVVLTARLPHPVNTYHQQFMHGIVAMANGVKIGNLKDLRNAIAKPQDGFHVLSFEGMEHVLVIDARAAAKAEAEVERRYGIHRTQQEIEPEINSK